MGRGRKWRESLYFSFPLSPSITPRALFFPLPSLRRTQRGLCGEERWRAVTFDIDHIHIKVAHKLQARPFPRLQVSYRLPFTFSLWDVPEAYRQSMPPSNVVTKGSALHCDCNVRWLKEWLLDKNLGDITCASPAKVTGVSVTKLKEKHLVCGMFYKLSSLSLTRK